MTFSNIIEVVCGALPTTLITLDLSYNNIQEISDCSLKGLTRRKQLHLTENNETTISYSAFRDLGRLSELYMAQMGIEVFDKRLLEHLPMLKVLDLHGNKLKRIDWTFTKTLTSLSYIDISENLFSELSNSSIMTLSHIKSIHLNDNNWKCNCALEWVKVLPSPIPESVNCSRPLSVRYLSIVNVPSSQLTCVPASVRCSSSSYSGKYHTQLNISCSFGGTPSLTFLGQDLMTSNYNITTMTIQIMSFQKLVCWLLNLKML